DDGTKVVVFGGRIDSNTFARDIWILDVPSLLWTQGPSMYEPRVSMACVVAGNTFIGWGGSNGARTVDGAPILFDLNTNQYIRSYIPPTSYTFQVDVFGNSRNGDNNNGRNTGGWNSNNSYNRPHDPSTDDRASAGRSIIIIICVIGTILIVGVGAVVSVYVRRRRQMAYQEHMERGQIFSSSGSGSGNGSVTLTGRHSTSNSLAIKKPGAKMDCYSFDEDMEDTKASRKNSNMF
ncbi:hypothetical protein BGZ94_008327, partial [Podila epigama]